MESKTKTILIVIVVLALAIFVGGAYFQKQLPIFAILDSGYSAPSDCSFITNVNPYTSRYTIYGNSGAWIAIDINNDGIKEKYGQRGTGMTTGSLGNIVVTDYNIEGDDIYTSSDGLRIYVASNSKSYSSFDKDYGSAINAITSCTSTCTENWQCSSWSTCNNNQQTRTCTDSNNCGTIINKPTTSQSCSVNGTCLVTDTNSNSKVDREELGTCINRWTAGI